MSRLLGKTKPPRHKTPSGLVQSKPRGVVTRTALARVVHAKNALIPAPAPANDVGRGVAAVNVANVARRLSRSKKRIKSVIPLAPEIEAVEALDGQLDALPVELDELAVVVAPARESDEAETEREVEEVDTEEVDEEQIEAKRADDEPASFLGMYFRDMAELDVLRPEQEFETARKIEEQELDLWRTILGFASGAAWVSDAIEKGAGETLPDITAYRLVAEHSRKKASVPERARFEKELQQLSERLRTVDIDRIFADAAVAAVNRLSHAVASGQDVSDIPFSTSTKAFREYGKAVSEKAIRLKLSKNEFVKANLRLVVSIARRFNHGRLPLADLIQEGNIGLMKAVERYDYRRGFRFSTYASWWIRHAISRALADKGRAVRLPVHMIDAYHRIAKSQRELQSKLDRPPTTEEIAAATGIELEKLEKMKTFLAETPVSLDRPLADGDGRRLIDVLVDPEAEPNVPEQMAMSETQSEMLKLLEGLRPIEADILRKRFGLETDKERTLKEIGDEYRLSRERVRQLQEQALGKMRRAMAKRETV
jgi:RNA polymerase primary sigma factor